MRSLKLFLFVNLIIVVSIGGTFSSVSAQEIPPNQPANISPSALSVDVSLTTELIGFTYSHTENVSHAASRWRITTVPGNYTGPVFDSQEDADNLLSISVPEGTLENDTMYYWQLGHKDADGNWSSFSDETIFTTLAAAVVEEEEEEEVVVEEEEEPSGSNLLIRVDNSPRIYYVTESGMKRHIPNPEVFVSYGNKWIDIEIVSQEELDSYEYNEYIHLDGAESVYKIEEGVKRLVENFETHGIVWEEVAPVNRVEYDSYSIGDVIEGIEEVIDGEDGVVLANPLEDGDIIRASGDDEVYIVKMAAGKKYKRAIFTPKIFDLYGHLSWDKLKIVPLSTLDEFVTSTILQVEYQLYGKEKDPRLWSVEIDGDVAILHPIDASAFSLEKNGWAPDSIFQITTKEFNASFYTQGETVVKNYLNPMGGPCGDYGDVTGDGVITHGDVVKLYIEASQSEQSELVISRGDVNNDSRITSGDSDMLNDYLTGKRNSLPVCGS